MQANNKNTASKSHTLLKSDFDSDWYRTWANKLKQDKLHLHNHKLRANKFWQNAVMAHILDENKKLRANNNCIGFGVGKERLPALFASLDINVLATDQDHRTSKAKHWKKYELATGTESLNKIGICPEKKFRTKVNYAPVDMNKISNEHFEKYDFAWSNCALGHLGSIDNGLDFIVNSGKCLKPGGIAVHTTEVNVLSNKETVDNNPETVIFRPLDLYLLSKKLLKEGLLLDVPSFTFGNTIQDNEICLRPQFGNDYSKLQVGGHIITQIVLIVRKPKRLSFYKKVASLYNHRIGMRNNVASQKKFRRQHSLINSIYQAELSELKSDAIECLNPELNVSIKHLSTKKIYLGFKNKTNVPLFSMHNRLHTTKPVTLGTSSPNDRKSIFFHESWYNSQENRPSINFYEKNKNGLYREIDYVKPGATFYFEVVLSAKKAKKRSYVENFSVLQEGNKYFNISEVKINVQVTPT